MGVTRIGYFGTSRGEQHRLTCYAKLQILCVQSSVRISRADVALRATAKAHGPSRRRVANGRDGGEPESATLVGGVPEGCARGDELGAIQVESVGSVSGPALAKDLVIIRAVGVGGRTCGHNNEQGDGGGKERIISCYENVNRL